MPFARRLYRRLESWVIFTHRWLGILTCLIFSLWFITGIVMIYVDYPRLLDEEQRAGLPALDWTQVRITPDEAMARAGLEAFPTDLRLEMRGPRPVYRVTARGGALTTISAADGAVLEGAGAAEAVEIARSFAPGTNPAWLGLFDHEAWTFGDALKSLSGFHTLALDDRAGTNLYILEATGEVVMNAPRAERILNWISTVPHLLYMPSLRGNEPLWRAILVWTTAITFVMTIAGIWIGIARLRPARRYANDSMSPYPGFRYWHHILGICGSLAILTWAGSSWIYFKPGDILQRAPVTAAALQAYAGHAAPTIPADLDRLRGVADANRITFAWSLGHPLALVMSRNGADAILDLATHAPLHITDDDIAAQAPVLRAGAQMRIERLTAPDDAWHSFRLVNRKLPVLRAVFDDPDATWFHIDPDTGLILGTAAQPDRAFRFLFNGLHKFDFYALTGRGPLHPIVTTLMMTLGAAVSVTGVVIGWKYLARFLRRRRRRAV